MAITATNVKSSGNTGLLNVGTNWTPTITTYNSSVTMGWNASSGTTGALGGSFTVGAIAVPSTAPSITIGNTAGAVMTLAGYPDGADTLLFDGSAMAATFNHNAAITFSASGIIDVGNAAAPLVMTGVLTGLSSVTLTKRGAGTWVSGTNSPSLASPITLNAGTLNLGAGGNTAGNTVFGTGKITANGGRITYGQTPAGVGYLTNAVDVRGNIQLGAGSGSATIFSGAVDLDSMTRTLDVLAAGATFSGTVTGTAGFTKAGNGTLTITVATPSLSGDVSVAAGTLATTTSVNALQAATLNWSGTVGTFSPLAGSNIGAIKGTTTTNTLALGTTAINVGGANTSETFSGKFTGSALITKNGTGTWTLDGDNSGHTGGFTVGTSGAGTLVAGSATALGASSAGAVTVVSGSTLRISSAVSKASATLTLAGAGVGSNGALRSISGTTSYTASGYTITSDVTIGVDAGTLSLGGAGAVMGTGGINKVGAGELVLLGESNTLDRQIVITAGTLTAKKLAPAGAVSSIGRGNTTPAIELRGTLKFEGTAADSTNRTIAFTGAAPTLDASGSAAVTFSACTTTGLTGGRLITFAGSNTGLNTLSATLSDGTGAVSVAKSGVGKWVLSGVTVNYTGTTTVSEGTLNLGGLNRTLSGTVTVAGGTLENGTNTLSANVVMTGGTITAQLTGNKTLDVNSGVATLQPTNNINDFTGNTSVAAGATLCLVTAATNISTTGGKVLGNSNVSVTGNLRTNGDAVQKGQMRYGGNLTFQANSRLYVGSLS